MKAVWLPIVFVCLILTTGANAQFVQDPLDQGVPDTVRLEVVLAPDAATNQLNIELDMYLFSDVQTVNSVALGFEWNNPNAQMVDGYWEYYGMGFFDFARFLWRNDDIDSTNAYQQFQCTGARSQGPGLIPGQAYHVCNYSMVLSEWDELDEVLIDTALVLGANFTFVDDNGDEYVPYWAPVVIHDPNRPILSNIVFSEDTLRFSTVYGTTSPPAQTVEISSDRDEFAFTVTENVSWLFAAPPSGFTPQDLDVSATLGTLGVGTYFDSIRVDAGMAANTPQFIFAEFEITPPPPTLAVAPTSLGFSAVAGGDDPPSQSLTINNTGGVPLAWTVSEGASWLSLDPLSGTDGETVTVSVSIAGLGYGTYNDVITVTDPAATNSPIEVPVQLTVATDLPVIAAKDEHNQFALPLVGPTSSTQTFEIYNAGEGALSFNLSWSPSPGSHIISVSPTTGTAPETITVDFDFDIWGTTATFYDTVWVHSSGALNTPLPVTFEQRVVANPATIVVPSDPVVLTVYECDQGYGNSMPTHTFLVLNSGGDNPMQVQVEYESELFEVTNRLSLGNAPCPIKIQALPVSLPTGIYYDTLYVTSPWAINKPQLVEIQYDYRPGDETPEIIAEPSPLELAYQLESPPVVYNDFLIRNVYGGCMDWTIASAPLWIGVDDVNGQVPEPLPLTIDAAGFTIGTHNGTITLTSPTAANSPYDVQCIMKVWKLRGDTNWNGRITLQDVALLIDYVYESEHAPQPIPAVGDVNCDDVVDGTDIVLVLEYMFESGPPLCGNPY